MGYAYTPKVKLICLDCYEVGLFNPRKLECEKCHSFNIVALNCAKTRHTTEQERQEYIAEAQRIIDNFKIGLIARGRNVS